MSVMDLWETSSAMTATYAKPTPQGTAQILGALGPENSDDAER